MAFAASCPFAGQAVVVVACSQIIDNRFQIGAIVEVQNLAHNGRNAGSETVRLAVFYTGEEGRPNVTRVKKPDVVGSGR